MVGAHFEKVAAVVNAAAAAIAVGTAAAVIDIASVVAATGGYAAPIVVIEVEASSLSFDRHSSEQVGAIPEYEQDQFHLQSVVLLEQVS